MRASLVSVWVASFVVLFGVASGCSCGSDANPFPPTTTTAQGGSGGTGGTGGVAGSAGGTPAECLAAADCDALFGPAPCGAWACNAGACEASSPGCVDADQDGYGTGANCACAGIDCDDTDDMILGDAVRSCYSGPSGTAGVGTCVAGTATCAAGVWGPCIGEITPSGEACNDEDDNCNGQKDDGLGTFTCGLGACITTVSACNNGQVGVCVPLPGAVGDGPACNGMDDDCDGPIDEDCTSCVYVATNGNDMTANGTLLLPFLTIQPAINFAVANNISNVCVTAGQLCGTQPAPVVGTYQNANNTTITMANGISVLGNYERTTGTRCPNSPFTTTVLQPQTAEGVTFPNTVTATTVLDGFRIDRDNQPTTSAVTVDGAKNVILSSLTISNTPSVQNSYAINVINGGQATITKGRIDAGNGSVESIAVRSVASQINITNNCLSIDNLGRCDDFCGNNPSIRGRFQQGTGTTYGVLLQNSPSSKIDTSAICGADADIGATVKIEGNGTGIEIRGNLVNAFGGAQHSHGIWMEDCSAAAPWIVDNFYIGSNGDTQMTSVDGIRAIGDCHPVVDSNRQISGGGEGQAANPNGVHCGANQAGISSQCVVLGNQSIRGSEFGFPPIATGVRCDGDGCLRIANNALITGRGGVQSYGIWMETNTAVVDNNLIRGGCSGTAVGVHAQDTSSRVQNNRISGFSSLDCPPAGGMSNQSIGLHVLLSAGNNEIDVHSNDLDGGGTPNACASRALAIDVTGMPPVSGKGIFRNNIIRAGVCGSERYNVWEATPAADPRIFQNNNLDPMPQAPTGLYFDADTMMPLNSAAAVNGLADMIVGNVISNDSMYLGYPADLHLLMGSPCIGAGTAVGVPMLDMDGQARDMVAPDIGADEF